MHRPASIRSVASNSSIASGVSLSRRPRTRARSKTITGTSSEPPSPAASDLPYLTGTFVQEPGEYVPSVPSIPLSALPARPPRSPDRFDTLEIPELRGSDTASSQGGTAADETIVEPLVNSGRPVRTSRLLFAHSGEAKHPLPKAKAAKVAASLPHLDLAAYRAPPSAFSRDPALTPVVNVRDSVSTQVSGTSSSLYPPSTPTASGPESPSSPQSMLQHFDSIHSVSFGPEVNEVQEYDSDDVSYRLRLLVKNNYFLPPAHSKPSIADLAPPSPDPSSKPTTPTFLDIFRLGKSKSKPSTPPGGVGVFDLSTPILRTTSDSITAGHALRTPDSRVSAQMARLAPSPNTAPRGRVVVVREKMLDIAVAAKQAEQDLKARGARIDNGSQKAKPVAVDDIIDPTDAVDIPIPSPGYPFAVQASALNGLSVQDSLGADVLADRLAANMSTTYDSAEDSWRKNLLHQAVHHSLDNTPDMSTFSHVVDFSTPPRSKSAETPRVLSPLKQQLIGQKIINQPMIDVIESTPKHKRQKSGQSQVSISKEKTKPMLSVQPNISHGSSRPSSYLPQRVDTPSGPMTPLGPAPRRNHDNHFFSSSQADLPDPQDPPYSPESFTTFESSPRGLRRALSTPQLAEGYHSSASLHDMMNPPMPSYIRDSQVTVSTINTVRGSGSYKTANRSGTLSDHPDSDHEDEDEPRHSLSYSIPPSRPSLSEYSQASMSPTTSTFQDMLNHEQHSGSSTNPGPSRFSIEQQGSMRGSPSLRYSAMSPPPRISSSLAHVALPPPPRSSSLSYRAQVPSALSISMSGSSDPTQADSDNSLFSIVAPEPTTPPLPGMERRSLNLSPRVPLSLSIPSANIPPGIHSAPGPTSPTSFFDTLQTHPNAMDDLDSSSDESEDDRPALAPQPKRDFPDPRNRAVSSVSSGNSKPSIMRLGNFSTPYLRSGESYHQNLLPISHNAQSKRPIGNTPLRPSRNDTLPSSSYDFFKYAQENPPSSISALAAAAESSIAKRPAPALAERDRVANWRNTQKAQDSLRKLDGMLIQHMEDEKDTIKRIATTLKQTGQP